MQLKENANLSDKITVRINWEEYDVYNGPSSDPMNYCGNELEGDERVKTFDKATNELELDEEMDYSQYMTSPEDGPSEHDFDQCHTGLFNCTVGDLKKMIEDYGVDPDILYVVHDGYRIFDVNSLVFDADE